MGNGDGTFQPAGHQYAVGIESQMRIVAGDFTGDGSLDLAVTDTASTTVSCCWATATAPFRPVVLTPVGQPARRSWPGISRETAGSTWPSLNFLSSTSPCCSTTATARSPAPASSPSPLMPRPWSPTSTATAPTMSWSSTAPGDILYRQGIPGQPGSFLPPVTVNPGIPLSRHRLGAEHRSRARAGQRRRPATTPSRSTPTATAASSGVGSLATGPLPAQIIAADLDGTGFDDLVVRNAGDGTLFVYFRTPRRPGATARSAPCFTTPRCLPSAWASPTSRRSTPTATAALDLVVTNKLTGQVGVLPNWAVRRLRPARALPRRDRVVRDRARRHARGHQPGCDGGRGSRAAHARRSDRPGDDQPRLELARRARGPGRRPLRQSRRRSRPRAPPRWSAWPTSPATASPTWPSSPPRA